MDDTQLSDENSNLENKDEITKSLVKTDVEYYLLQIPTSDDEIKKSNKQIADALFSIGMIYKEDIEDSEKAKLTFDELEERFPSDERLADIYYNLYQMNMKANNQTDANFMRNQIISKFPNSPYAKIFSMPESSSLNPVPIDKSVDTFPLTLSEPLSGSKIPAINFSKVVLPDPFEPTTPIISPLLIWKLISFNAQNCAFFFLLKVSISLIDLFNFVAML